MAKKEGNSLVVFFASCSAMSFFFAAFIGNDIERYKTLGLPPERIAEKLAQQSYCWYAIAFFAVLAAATYGLRTYAGLRRRQQELSATFQASDSPKSEDDKTKILVRR